MCIDMRAGIVWHVPRHCWTALDPARFRTDMTAPMHQAMPRCGGDICADMCVGMRTDVCIDMCTDMCTDMFIDMCIVQ